jgi:small subunit ribosomal protein S18
MSSLACQLRQGYPCTLMLFECMQIRREVDYKNIPMLVSLVGKQGAILGRRKGHIRAVTQRKIARAVKNARQMALMPHVGMHPAFIDTATAEMQALFDDLELRAASTQR